MKRLVILTALITTLVLPAAAQAKGQIESLRVCGASACADVPVGATLRHEGFSLFGGGPATSPPWIGPYYRLLAKVGGPEHGTFGSFLIPAEGGWSRSGSGWNIAPTAVMRDISHAAAGVEPVRIRMAGVTVNHRAVGDASAFSALLAGALPRVTTTPLSVYRDRVAVVRVGADRANPWADPPASRTIEFNFAPTAGLISFAGTSTWYRLPAPVSSQIRRMLPDPPAAATAESGSGGSHRADIAAAGVLLLAAALGARRFLRRPA
jgi:hypothetical protein